MARKKKPQGKKKQQQVSLAPRRQTRSPMGLPKSVVSNVCGLVDPFCTHARGCKYPDDSSTRTLPWSSHGRFTIVSGPAGTAGALFMPTYANLPNVNLASYPTAAGVMVVSTATADADKIAGVNNYRIVSAGFKLRSVVAPLNASGMVHLRSWGVESMTELGFGFNGLTYGANDSVDVRLQDCRDLAAVSAHTAAMPQLFYAQDDYSTDVATWAMPGFRPVSILLLGVPADSIVAEVEYFVHYELTFEAGQQLAILATPAPPSNALVTTAANRVTSMMGSLFERGVEAAGRYVETAARKALIARLGPVAGYLMPAREID